MSEAAAPEPDVRPIQRRALRNEARYGHFLYVLDADHGVKIGITQCVKRRLLDFKHLKRGARCFVAITVPEKAWPR